MKKILSGMLFRLVRGYEIWALLALFILISGYFTFVEIATLDYVAVKTGYTNTFYIDMENSVITKENAEQYCYKNSGISAYDLYRYRIEKLPQETFDKIHKDMNSEPVYEVRTIFRLVFRSYLVASVLMVIFIPIFFGRLFSDGTIKNLVSGGYSKRLIYLSSLLLTFAIDLVLNVASLVIIAVLCLILQWLPPIYLPVLLPAFLLSVLLSFTITSVSIGSLFAGGKKTVAFILGFVMVAARFFSSSFFASGLLLSGQLMSYHDLSEETKELIKESGPNNLEVKLDLSQFIEKFYINGERVIYVFADESTYPKAVVNTLLVLVYGDPYLIDTTFVYVGYDAYSMARDGLMAINFAANAFWILFFNGVALFIFNKRELHC
jgi:ABC-type transport system involved in multi-copper enzyme maturation permease subunit